MPQRNLGVKRQTDMFGTRMLGVIGLFLFAGGLALLALGLVPNECRVASPTGVVCDPRVGEWPLLGIPMIAAAMALWARSAKTGGG